MLIRFTTPCVLGTTEYASGAEADLPPDVANMALSLGRGVRVMADAEAAPAPDPQATQQPELPATDAAPDDGGRPKRR
jgi:hypothetical protein